MRTRKSKTNTHIYQHACTCTYAHAYINTHCCPKDACVQDSPSTSRQTCRLGDYSASRAIHMVQKIKLRSTENYMLDQEASRVTFATERSEPDPVCVARSKLTESTSGISVLGLDARIKSRRAIQNLSDQHTLDRCGSTHNDSLQAVHLPPGR